MSKDGSQNNGDQIDVEKNLGSSGITNPPRTFWATVRRLGPGMIIAGSIVGSGELILTTKVGAEAGFYLLWLIVLGCVIKVFTQVEFGRYTITWNKTPLKALDSVPGPRRKVNWVLWYWGIMTLLVVSQQGGIVGGIGQTLAITKPLTQRGVEYDRLQDHLVKAKVELAVAQRRGGKEAEILALQAKIEALTEQAGRVAEPKDAYIWSIIFAVITSLLLWVGSYGLIQACATVLVVSFTLVTICTLLLLQTKPDWAITSGEFTSGLSFRLPPIAEQLGKNPIVTALGAFGIIGVGAAELIMYPYWCIDKGYARFTGLRDGSKEWIERARGWMKVLYVDAFASMVVYTLATVAFFLLGAAVLGRTGLNPQKAEMVRTLGQMYVPVFGSWAEGVFLFGAFAVLYSTFFVAAAGNARMIADALGLFGLTDGSEAARQKWTKILSVAWPIVALVVYLFVRAAGGDGVGKRDWAGGDAAYARGGGAVFSVSKE